MNYLHQACLIFSLSFLAEILNRLIPLPIPASIYGMVLLFGALQLRLIPIRAVKDMGSFLTSILPVLFVPPIVSLLDHWELLQANLVPIALILLASTLVTFAISGGLAQAILNKQEDESHV